MNKKISEFENLGLLSCCATHLSRRVVGRWLEEVERVVGVWLKEVGRVVGGG